MLRTLAVLTLALVIAGCSCAATEAPRAVYASPCTACASAEAAPLVTTYAAEPTGRVSARAALEIPGNVVGCLSHAVEGVGKSLRCVADSFFPVEVAPPAASSCATAAPAACYEAAPAACAESVVEEPYTVTVPVQSYRTETRVRRYRVQTFTHTRRVPMAECAPAYVTPEAGCAPSPEAAPASCGK